MDFDTLQVGEIAASVPGATTLFRHYKIDFCCGGKVLLEEATRRRGVDADRLKRELADLEAAGAAREAPTETAELIRHIVDGYHRVHRQELPELLRLAEKVERVHREHADCPIGLSVLLRGLADELVGHMDREEAVLFPMMISSDAALIGPITRMMLDHEEMGLTLDQVRALTLDFTAPAGACTTWRALIEGLRKFATDLEDHTHLENNVLFPRFLS